MRLAPIIGVAAAAGTLFFAFVPTWTPSHGGVQMGYRSGSAVQFKTNQPEVERMNQPPAPTPPGSYGVTQEQLNDSRPADQVYQNIKALKGISAGEFMKLQVAYTDWVSPKQGCSFCHAGDNFASDEKPQKRAAEIMTQMVQTINADWRNHVAEQGVTCYTCHRGLNVPASAWYPEQHKEVRKFVARQEGWHESATTVRDFFPYDSFAEYWLQDTSGRGQAYNALPIVGKQDSEPRDAVVVKRLYEVMMQQTDGIGVNCGYCHNSRAFFDWRQSTPKRWIGLYGIQMTRAINNDFLLPITQFMPQTRQLVNGGRLPITPAHEAGAQNGNALAICRTCHLGAPKPLNGVNMVDDYPALLKPAQAAAAPQQGAQR